jgi:hypothetical protein
MKKLVLSDVKDLVAYERVRDTMRAEIIALKNDRRLGVGDNLTLLFENRATVLFQVQEMVRTERIVDDAKIQDELDAYNPLVPAPGHLSATLFIEIPELYAMTQQQVHAAINRFQGLDQDVIRLKIGGEEVPARFEAGRTKEEKMAAVQFVDFTVPDALRSALSDPRTEVSVVVRHPNYTASEDVPPAMRAQFVADLADTSG